MKTTTPSQATVRPAKERKTSTKAAAKQVHRQATGASHSQVTLGFDLGDRKHTY